MRCEGSDTVDVICRSPSELLVGNLLSSGHIKQSDTDLWIERESNMRESFSATLDIVPSEKIFCKLTIVCLIYQFHY